MSGHEAARYITGGHKLAEGATTHYCRKCRESWPCEVTRLTAQVAAVRALAEMYDTGGWTVDNPHVVGQNFLAVLADPSFMTGVTP